MLYVGYLSSINRTKNVYQKVDSPGKFSQSKYSLIKAVELASIQHPYVPDYIFLSHLIVSAFVH